MLAFREIAHYEHFDPRSKSSPDETSICLYTPHSEIEVDRKVIVDYWFTRFQHYRGESVIAWVIFYLLFSPPKFQFAIGRGGEGVGGR